MTFRGPRFARPPAAPLTMLPLLSRRGLPRRIRHGGPAVARPERPVHQALHQRGAVMHDDPPPTPPNPTRRTFLRTTGETAAAAVIAGYSAPAQGDTFSTGVGEPDIA